jgi:branched-chain amino acid transport system substrate-binding protein
MNKKNAIITAAVLAVLAIGALIYFQKTPGTDSKVIRVAANMPMSGELAFYGNEIRDGLLMAVEDTKEKLPSGTSITFDWGDNRFTPKDAATVLQRQLQQSPTFYTSALKPQVMAVEKEVAQAGIPHLAWVLDLSPNPQGTTNNFRTWVSFKLECDVFFEHAKARGAKNMVLCFVSLPSSEAAYGVYLAGRLRNELGCNVIIERYNPDVSAGDFRNIATRVASNKPDLLMLNGFIPQMVGIIRGLRPLAVIGDGNTMAALDMLDAAGALSPEESEGILVAAPPFIISPDEKQKDWMSRFEKKFGRKPSYHAAFAYDGGITLVDTASRLQLPASSKQWLEGILATDTQGITGRIHFDNDQSIITSLKPAMYRNGVLVPMSK